jgi:hypothetical protein
VPTLLGPKLHHELKLKHIGCSSQHVGVTHVTITGMAGLMLNLEIIMT